jgi:hypothetical protein
VHFIEILSRRLRIVGGDSRETTLEEALKVTQTSNREEKTMTTIHKQITATTTRTIMWWRVVTREVIVPPGGV